MNLLKRTFTIFSAGALTLLGTSCQNDDVDFPDYEGGVSVYFANPYLQRTLELGPNKNYDNSEDLTRSCMICGTMGGTYKGKNIKVEIAVDNSLTDKMFFADGTAVKPMPAEYYKLASNTLDYGGKYMGGVEVTFTDAFFADPASITTTYAIPLVMKSQTGADRILTGTAKEDIAEPNRCNGSDWEVTPKDYVIYCMQYINNWHGTFLRRGVDVVTGGINDTTIIRHNKYVEKDAEISLATAATDKNTFPVSITVGKGDTQRTLTCNVQLTFDKDNNCTVTSATPEFQAKGTGKFVVKGEKKSWGNQDRDAIYLDYSIDFEEQHYATKDTLVFRNRGAESKVITLNYQAN